MRAFIFALEKGLIIAAEKQTFSSDHNQVQAALEVSRLFMQDKRER